MESDEVKQVAGQQQLWTDIVNRIPQEIDTHIKGVSATMDELQKQTKDLKEDMAEQENINSRKNCIIVHGLPEPSADTVDARKQDEYNNISDLLHQVKCDEVSVNSYFRLGKIPDGPDAKPRPVRLTLVSEAQKDKILRNAKNLKGNRNGFEKIYIHQDLTPIQRAARQKLVLELKQRIAQGQQNLIIVNDKIVVRRQQPQMRLNKC